MRTGTWTELFAKQYRKQLLMADLAGVETRASLALQKLRAARETEERPRLARAARQIAELRRRVEGIQ